MHCIARNQSWLLACESGPSTRRRMSERSREVGPGAEVDGESDTDKAVRGASSSSADMATSIARAEEWAGAQACRWRSTFRLPYP